MDETTIENKVEEETLGAQLNNEDFAAADLNINNGYECINLKQDDYVSFRTNEEDLKNGQFKIINKNEYYTFCLDKEIEGQFTGYYLTEHNLLKLNSKIELAYENSLIYESYDANNKANLDEGQLTLANENPDEEILAKVYLGYHTLLYAGEGSYYEYSLEEHPRIFNSIILNENVCTGAVRVQDDTGEFKMLIWGNLKLYEREYGNE